MKDNHKQYFTNILRKYRLGTASPEEVDFLERYYDLFDSNEELSLTVEDSIRIKGLIKNSIDQELDRSNTLRKTNPWQWFRYAAAASVVVMLSITLFLLLNPRTDNGSFANREQDIAPGGNKAVLTLANGRKIVLDDAAQGQLNNQSGISIIKTADGQVVYKVNTEEGNTTEVTRNTISTPNGGQYTIILSDGTKVKLNASSSLSFPNIFGEEDRTVDLEGEAYFEVAKQNGKNFLVHSGIQTVQVLGTHFNIDAYADEKDIRTTLLEGSVKVILGEQSVLITPGQQAVVTRTGNISKKDVDLEKEVSWINEQFAFDNDDLKSVMRQISRWYDVNIVYVGDIPDKKFFGGIPRNSKLSEVFKILELNNIQSELNGNTVKVSYAESSPTDRP